MANSDREPAFPRPLTAELVEGGDAWDVQDHGAKGMSLRDYFAGQALAGFCASPDFNFSDNDLANRSYEIADKMLVVRATT